MWSFGHSYKDYPLVLVLAFIASSLPNIFGESAKDDPRLKAPWVASIFHKNPASGIWELVCSGTIVSPYTVITSARCLRPRVTGEKFSSRPYHYNYGNLQVVAGLKSNNYDAKDEYTQYGVVGQIRDLFDNSDTPYKDLAALRLKNKFNMSTAYVKEALLTEHVGTILEANATKAGDTVTVAGFERSDTFSGVKTRSQVKSDLMVYQITLADMSTCINRYLESYKDSYYIDVICGKYPENSKDACRLEGAGMITKIKSPVKTGDENYYLMGVYSSNTALAKSEGTILKERNAAPIECTPSDYIFFTKLGYLGRWAISHNFCDNELAMCLNNKCRPWKDLCDGVTQCDDLSDESAEVCFNQAPCSSNQFRCKYGACIDKKKKCDGTKDCNDGSDEDLVGSCKDIATRATNCPGIPDQKGVETRCTHPDRKDIFSCKGATVPQGTTAVLKRNEVRATCTLGKWSQSVMLPC